MNEREINEYSGPYFRTGRIPQSTPNALLFQSGSRTRLFRGCFPDILEGSPILCLFPDSIFSESHRQHQNRQCLSNPQSSLLVYTDLVYLSLLDVSSTSLSPSLPTRAANPELGNPATSLPPNTAFDTLAPGWFQNAETLC